MTARTPAVELQSVARMVVDLVRSEAAEGSLDGLDRIGQREQAPDVGLGQVERHWVGV